MQQNISGLKIPVRYIKGVGPKKAEVLLQVGISTVEDLLYHLPLRYEDRSRFTSIKDVKAGEHQTIRGIIVEASLRSARKGTSMVQALIRDDSGVINATWFNQPYLHDSLKAGQGIVLYGKVERYDRIQIVQPEYEFLESSEDVSIHVGRIVPIYPLSGSLTQRLVRTLVYAALSAYANNLHESLPTYLLAKERLVDLHFAIQNIHFPINTDSLDKAYRRIVFEEFFILQVALARRKKTVTAAPGLLMKTEGPIIDSFKRSLPYLLTEGQRDAIKDIEKDLTSGRPMNRLLEGDVGSGKTSVAAYALVLAIQNGCQGVLMAPTEVLARQQFMVLSEQLMPLGINVALLISALDGPQKVRLLSEISLGKIDLIVGTHAIIQEAVNFSNLGLVVIDEQHKFGVTQRSLIRQKGYEPHVLVMTATPIPRTLAMTVYGDLDVSIIRELPKGRKPIITYWIEEARRMDAYRFVLEEVRKGHQAYIVCPLIDSRGKTISGLVSFDARKAAVDIFEYLQKSIFLGIDIGLLHGKLSSKDKERVMREFKAGKIKVLVSTVVIEVGIDVSNATVMLVENADRFGLAQLHQLRGRIGRGTHDSYCILLADPSTEEARKRLVAIEETLDGFSIAETDLSIRGPGVIFGTKQHGLPQIRFGDIVKDIAIMEAARGRAIALISKDPELKEEHHRRLREKMRECFQENLEPS